MERLIESTIAMCPVRASTVETPEAIEITDIGAGEGFEAEVIVYNCDCHTYQQVISLFCRYIPGMTPTRAFELAWQIDHQGSAVVFQGDQQEANTIAANLAGGGLRVSVR